MSDFKFMLFVINISILIFALNTFNMIRVKLATIMRTENKNINPI